MLLVGLDMNLQFVFVMIHVGTNYLWSTVKAVWNGSMA